MKMPNLRFSLFSIPAQAQELSLKDLKSFGVVRDVKNTAVDFLSCFSAACFPASVTTALSPSFISRANAVDLGGVNV